MLLCVADVDLVVIGLPKCPHAIPPWSQAKIYIPYLIKGHQLLFFHARDMAHAHILAVEVASVLEGAFFIVRLPPCYACMFDHPSKNLKGLYCC